MSSYGRYIPMSERRAKAARAMVDRADTGRPVRPVHVEGRAIAKTFWGKAWCDHIEMLADFRSRLDKGKTYVRNGSVAHLWIDKGYVEAVVAGSDLYSVAINIDPMKPAEWERIKRACSGQMSSVVELLQGKFSDATMRILTDPQTGMFPRFEDFDTDCSCPDFVRLCKHLAAALYGVGARLDDSPELLFTLRGVDPTELLQSAASFKTTSGKSGRKTLADDALGDVFGIELVDEPVTPKKPAKRKGK